MTLLWLERLLSRPKVTQPRPDVPQRAADASARDEARKFLRKMLAAGSVPAEELLRRARELGHAEKTVRRAKADLVIRAHRVGQGREQRWFWKFPEIATTQPAEAANGNADVATLACLAILPSNGKTQFLDQSHTAMRVVAGVADEGPDGGEESPAEGQGDSELSRDSHTRGRPDPDDVLVPSGFTVCWDLKPAPLKLDRGVTVLNAEDFVKTHLEILAAKLRGDKSWLYEQWPMPTLLADLKEVGVELRIP
jgi:hypothetical protein